MFGISLVKTGISVIASYLLFIVIPHSKLTYSFFVFIIPVSLQQSIKPNKFGRVWEEKTILSFVCQMHPKPRKWPSLKEIGLSPYFL